MFRLFGKLKPMLPVFIMIVVLFAGAAMAELYLPGMMSDIINDGIFLDYEPMYEHETMENPFGEIDITGSVEGFDKKTIPVFEMKDGFSTIDIKKTWNERFSTFSIDFNFMDIPVKDSRELFNDVLVPFMNSLKEYQFYKMEEKYSEERGYDVKIESIYDYTVTDQAAVRSIMQRLIDFESLMNLPSNHMGVTVTTFLTMIEETADGEEGDIWEDDNAKRLLTSCVINMKHSTYGNLLPIPVDQNGNRLLVDASGAALDKSELLYKIDSETKRALPFPDYEIILCNKVLGYAYKYENGQKWIKNSLGTSEKEITDSVAKNEQPVTGIKKFFEILSLSKRGSSTDYISKKTDKTREEWLTPDGITIQTSDMNYIMRKGFTMLGLTVLVVACTLLAMLFSARLAAFFSRVLRSDVFTKVERFSLAEFDKFSTASLVTRSTNDINQIQNVFLIILRTTLGAPVTIIGGFILSFTANISMTMVIIYVMPILFVAAGIAAVVVQPLFKLIQVKVDHLTLIMRENVTGIRVIRAFNRQGKERERFSEVNESVTRTAIVLQRYCAILVPLINICLNCASVGIFWRAAKQVADNSISDVGKMLEVSQYVTQIAMAMVFVASAIVMFPRASASAERILKVLDTEVSITDAENAVDNGDRSGTIEFNNVSFKYHAEAEKNILENISFKCTKGKVLAIVGGTGSGKSTVISLIPRFYNPTEGTVLIDGQDVTTYPQAVLRHKIGFVPQRSMLFSGTIADNLRYGKEDATDEEMWNALTIAQSDTFVHEKENNLLSTVEQGGNNFSGGQKQRLSIARAVVRQPDIYIFDDSFSALDFKTDAKLRAALKEVTQEAITIIVAQRIGTIMDADEIIVLDDGRMVGKGRHNDLLRGCKLYRDIALSQFSAEELGL